MKTLTRKPAYSVPKACVSGTHIESFLRYLTAQLSPLTIQSYSRAVADLERWLQKPAIRAKRAQIYAYLQKLPEGALTTREVGKMLKSRWSAGIATSKPGSPDFRVRADGWRVSAIRSVTPRARLLCTNILNQRQGHELPRVLAVACEEES